MTPPRLKRIKEIRNETVKRKGHDYAPSHTDKAARGLERRHPTVNSLPFAHKLAACIRGFAPQPDTNPALLICSDNKLALTERAFATLDPILKDGARRETEDLGRRRRLALGSRRRQLGRRRRGRNGCRGDREWARDGRWDNEASMDGRDLDALITEGGSKCLLRGRGW